MSKNLFGMLCTIVLVISLLIVLDALGQKEQKTLVEELMDKQTFKSCGLNKLTREELQNLSQWLKDALNIAYQKGKSEGNVLIPEQPGLKTIGDLEEAIILKDFDGDKVIVQRSNGEKWLLAAKTWCRWSWRYEGRKVLLKFGYLSSKLISGDGEECEFWTETKI